MLYKVYFNLLSQPAKKKHGRRVNCAKMEPYLAQSINTVNNSVLSNGVYGVMRDRLINRHDSTSV